jgi:Ala-tRNA(Pro) deacylase
MAISKTLQSYLQNAECHYKLVNHPHSGSSMETAETAHVPGDALAKGVVLRDDAGLLLVVVPSDYHVELDALNALLGRRLEFVAEHKLREIFSDCEPGAVPPIGAAYSIETVWDPEASLGKQEHIFFEAGDHLTLVRVSGKQFHELMAGANRAHFSHHI